MIHTRGKIFAALLAVFLVLVSCSKRPADEELIRAAVASAVKSAELKDVSAFMKKVSRSYRDDYGNDYGAIKAILFSRLFVSEKNRFFVSGVSVEVKGDMAVADVKVVMVFGKEPATIKEVLPEDAAAMRFGIVLARKDGDWKAVSASWERIGLAGLI